MPPLRTTQFILSLLLAVWLTSVASASEKLSLASPFTDHAVLQRDMPVPVWGRAQPGAKVVVRFADQEKSVTTDKDGKWMLKLDRLTASMDGRELVVVSQAETLRINDVLIGEVWLSTGFTTGSSTMDQSQTESGLKDQALDNDAIRVFEPKFIVADEPKEACQGQWRIPQRRNVLTLFAQGLQAKLGVPVGVINPSAFAMSRTSASWISRSALESSGAWIGLLHSHQERVKQFEFFVKEWEKDDGKTLKARAEANWMIAYKAGKKETRQPVPKPDPKDHPNRLPDRPAVAFNGMIAPLVPFAIRGLVFNRASDYSQTALIDAWRKEWNQTQLSIVVCIFGWNRSNPDVRDDFVYVSIGCISETERDSFEGDLAQRTSLATLAKVYGADVEWVSPSCDRVSVDGKKIALHFTGCGSGLLKGNQDIEGFDVQNAEGTWKRANAELNGDTVIVSSDDVPQPVRVRLSPVSRRGRYAEYELWNKAGLPVQPFDRAVKSKP